MPHLGAEQNGVIVSHVIVVSGPAGSGKTRWTEKWVAEDPKNRVRAGSIAQAMPALTLGKDVVLDLEQLTGHDVEVQTFA